MKDWPVLIPYYLSDEDKVCPSYFNNIQKTGSPWGNAVDPFELNEGVPVDKRIPARQVWSDPAGDTCYS